MTSSLSRSLLLLYLAAAVSAFVLPGIPSSSRAVNRSFPPQSSSFTTSKSSNNDNDNEADTDPDLVGVHVDGYPLPSIPTRSDDATLVARLNQVPGQDSLYDRDPSLVAPRTLTPDKPLRVLVAGGGLGGLAVASALLRQGFNVHVLEQAVQYKPFGGPIQLQSNALWALEQIAPELYNAIQQCGVQTGDRLSGIKDGLRYQEGWLVKFDAATPALQKGLPLTVAINRVVLQEIFLKYGLPSNRIHTNARVVSYQDNPDAGGGGVIVTLENGETLQADLLVGADGIWSRVRHQLCGLPPEEVGIQHATKHAKYSGYTCFTGTCRHTPDDIDTVAYKVFLGQEQYLGCTDAGHGWQHWWAFLPDPPGLSTKSHANDNHQTDEEKGRAMLERLQREFQDWSPEIHDLFDATQPKVVRQRDLFDRTPMWEQGWTDINGKVVLLGDACHPTMPNLGQGGAMAIEDAYVMAQELKGIQHTDEIPKRLQKYVRRRFVRASIAQFLSRNGSDLLVDWEKLRQTPIVGPIAMQCINLFQPISMNYLYSADL